MLEARAHQQLKDLLRQEGELRWPHHLTLSRLVARSLRRADQTLVRLAPGSDPSWLLGLLVPLALHEGPVALLVSPALRQRLLQVELPRLEAVGLSLPCWEGASAPDSARLWLLQHDQLVAAWRAGGLADRQLVIPEGELLQPLLRQALGRVQARHKGRGAASKDEGVDARGRERQVGVADDGDGQGSRQRQRRCWWEHQQRGGSPAQTTVGGALTPAGALAGLDGQRR